jgi:hypothetical protein
LTITSGIDCSFKLFSTTLIFSPQILWKLSHNRSFFKFLLTKGPAGVKSLTELPSGPEFTLTALGKRICEFWRPPIGPKGMKPKNGILKTRSRTGCKKSRASFEKETRPGTTGGV